MRLSLVFHGVASLGLWLAKCHAEPLLQPIEPMSK
jgi:hypothetical protein